MLILQVAPVHPRAYGSYAQVLGHYARDEKMLPVTRFRRSDMLCVWLTRSLPIQDLMTG